MNKLRLFYLVLVLISIDYFSVAYGKRKGRKGQYPQKKKFDHDLYSDTSDFQKQAILAAILKYHSLIEWKQSDAKILDIGSGDGSTTAEILLPFISNNVDSFQLTGIDYLTGMVKKATSKYRKKANVEFKVMDIAKDELSPGYIEAYDQMFSFFCLHLVPNYKNWIKNVHQMLKQNGSIFFLIPTQNPLFAEIFESSKDPTFSKYLTYAAEIAGTPFAQSPTPDQWIGGLLREGGFKNVTVENMKQVYRFKNENHLKSFIKVFRFIYEEMPKEMHKKFCEEFLKKVAARCQKTGDTLSFEYSLVLIIAYK